MTRPDISAIRERCEKANGPWPHEGVRQHDLMNQAAHARQDIPALLAYIEALEGLVREYGLKHGATCPCDIGVPADGCDCGVSERLAELGLEKS